MNFTDAFVILEISLSEINYEDITLDHLKKQYKKLALKNHPDKNGNTEESNENFKKINEAYHFLKHEFKKESLDNEDDEEFSAIYFDNLRSFMKTFFEGNYNDFLSKIVNDIINTGKKISSKIFDDLDKENALHIYTFLSNNRSTLHISKDILEVIRNIVVNKYNNVEVYKLNPSINDLLNNNLYKLYARNNLYLVPLWHNESYFDVSGCELIVICEPELPKDINIDNDNNIQIQIHIKGTDMINFLLNNKNIELTIGEKQFEIPISKLYMKIEQYYIIKNVGLSRIKKNIYDISEKTDIIVKIIII